MSILKKAKGLTKKLGSIITKPEDLDALFSGVYYYNNPHDDIEQLKHERAKVCDTCSFKEEDDFEPVSDTDDRISGFMCGECFCSLPYLLRQTKKGCEHNKWK